MNTTPPKEGPKRDPEIEAINTVYSALMVLEPEAQGRIIDYVTKKLSIMSNSDYPQRNQREQKSSKLEESYSDMEEPTIQEKDDLQGISPVAKKWISRNSLNTNRLSTLYSLGVDEIDLVARKVPGKGKREKMLNVLLLKGIAAYLSTGVARITYDQLKEAATHYDAYDAPNFSKYIKTMSAEASGSKEGGFTLTARGLTNATELIKGLLAQESP